MIVNYNCTPAVRRICELLLGDHSLALTRANPGGWYVGGQKVNSKAAWKLVWLNFVRPSEQHWQTAAVAYFDVTNYDDLWRYVDDSDFIPPVVAAIMTRDK